MLHKLLLTIRGLKGGLIFLCSRRTQSISLKNGCCLIASSPFCDATQPSRLLGFFVMNYRVGRKGGKSYNINGNCQKPFAAQLHTIILKAKFLETVPFQVISSGPLNFRGFSQTIRFRDSKLKIYCRKLSLLLRPLNFI